MSGWKDEDFATFWAYYNLCHEWVVISNSARQAAISDLEWKQAESDVYSMLNVMRPSAASGNLSSGVSADAAAIDNASTKKTIESVPTQTEIDDEDDDEISDEMIEFMRKTQAHREERDRLRVLEQEKSRQNSQSTSITKSDNWLRIGEQNDYVMASEVGVYGVRRQTTDAPVDAQKSAVAYKEEMRRRYGSAAEKLIAMEMSMNFKFTQHENKHHPELWPNIPLRF